MTVGLVAACAVGGFVGAFAFHVARMAALRFAFWRMGKRLGAQLPRVVQDVAAHLADVTAGPLGRHVARVKGGPDLGSCDAYKEKGGTKFYCSRGAADRHEYGTHYNPNIGPWPV